MSRVTRSHPLEFGATEPHPEGFAERGSFLSGLFNFSRMFRAAADQQGQLDLSLPRAIGEVPRPAAGASAVPVERPVSWQQAPATGAQSLAEEIERLVLHVAASDRPARAQRILVTHVSCAEAPLGGLDCAAFASQFARALSLEGRAILVSFGAGSDGRIGLSELIEGSVSFSEAIHREAGSRLHILPPGHRRALPGEGLNVVMEALAETYDFVVLAMLDDDREAAQKLSLALAPRADHAVIGCAGQAGSPEVMALRNGLCEAGAGSVLAARMGMVRADVLAA
jgi:polysaccharide biosynthesis transport protein